MTARGGDPSNNRLYHFNDQATDREVTLCSGLKLIALFSISQS